MEELGLRIRDLVLEAVLPPAGQTVQMNGRMLRVWMGLSGEEAVGGLARRLGIPDAVMVQILWQLDRVQMVRSISNGGRAGCYRGASWTPSVPDAMAAMGQRSGMVYRGVAVTDF